MTAISTVVQTVPTTMTTISTGVQTVGPQPRTYAEALTQTESRNIPPRSLKLRGITTTTSTTTSTARANDTTSQQPASIPQRTTRRAYVVHGVRSGDKLWKVREEIERDNKGYLGQLQGIRWLLQAERRKGKGASSVVIYLDCPKARPPYAWLGHRKLRVDVYEFDRGRDVEMT